MTDFIRNRGLCLLLFLSYCAHAATLVADISGVRPGPIAVAQDAQSLKVSWRDSISDRWEATFSLDTAKPLITAIAVNGRDVVTLAQPVYRCTTGKRSGGWDAFFDFPPANPAGTRRFMQEFHPTTVAARTTGNRVEVTFNGMKLGIFSGELRYIFYPGTPLIQQVALLSNQEPDTAYFYDAGLQMASPQDIRAGGNMASSMVYYDAGGKLTRVTSPYGSERHTLTVRYRAVAAKMGTGSLAVFPPPHRYMFARDYTTNQGYLWYTAWRGQVGLGVQQYPDDNTGIDPWMNAPPGTVQEMGLFLLPGAGSPDSTLKDVLAYTHNDRFPHLDGFITFAPHWHLAYTVQAMEKGSAWIPPFKPVMERAGIDAAMINDFHGDGHPADLTELRLHELDEYYKMCRAQSDAKFLLIPAEEANVYLGGHWALVFPRPVYWMQNRSPGQPFKSADTKYGTVYRVHSTDEMWALIKAEGGYVYQTHPRTKGSTGFPDKILNTGYFRDPSYLGTGWKSMPSDLSLAQLGQRGFKTIDDLNNLGLRKHMLGEIDVFQLSETDELYGLLNLNYLHLPHLPSFDHYDEILKSVQTGDGFISTGEVLLPAFELSAKGSGEVQVNARVTSTFPLRLAAVVWGDGKTTHRETIPLDSTPAFDSHTYAWSEKTPEWIWARLEIWDVAGDGVFTQPIWRAQQPTGK
ncbi:MAG: hypothetical protein WA510_20045 [Acidobacteriaceae bacterium]